MTTPPTRRAPRKAAAKPATRRRAPAKASAKASAAAKAAPAKPVVSAKAAWSLGAIAVAAGAGIAAFLTRGRIAALLSREGHTASDLTDTSGPSLAKEGDERAPEAFRPDMDAPMTAAERAALAPATGPGPSMISTRGTMNSQTGPSN